MRKNLIDKLNEVYSNVGFTVYTREPFLVYHDSEELADDDELISVFVDAYLECYGENGIETAAIAYDFRKMSSLFSKPEVMMFKAEKRTKSKNPISSIFSLEFPRKGITLQNCH